MPPSAKFLKVFFHHQANTRGPLGSFPGPHTLEMKWGSLRDARDQRRQERMGEGHFAALLSAARGL